MAKIVDLQAAQLAIAKANRERKIVERIRKCYSIDEELAIQRKHAMGTLSDDEWNIYIDYVESCIAEVDKA